MVTTNEPTTHEPGTRLTAGMRLHVLLLAVGALIFGPTDLVSADDLRIYEHRSIAPISIPISPAATDGIGMTRLRIRNWDNFDSVTSISQLTLQLVSDGTVEDSSIIGIWVYFEGNDGAVGYGVYDNGASNDDVLVSTGSPSFSGGVATVAVDPTKAKFGWGGGEKHLHVVLDFADTANTATNLACAITEVTYGTENVGNQYNTTDDGPAIPALVALSGSPRKNLDNYEVTLVATGIAPAEAEQTTARVPVMRLVFEAADASVTAEIDSIRLRRVGAGSADSDLTTVKLYDDSGSTPGSFDDTDAEVPGGAGAPSGGYVTLTPTNNLQITAASKTYFVAVEVAGGATVGATIGLEIQDPAAHVDFIDVIDDDLSTVPEEYAYVTQGHPYLQEGYLDTGAPSYEAPTPTTGNTFTILELVLPDTTPPSVVATSPPNGGTLASLDSPVIIYFSEDVQGADDPDSYTFTDIDGAPLPGGGFTVVYSSAGGEYTATLQPTAPLNYQTFYKVTVIAAGITDYATPAPNVMAADKEITFGTGLEFPLVTEPTVVKNRIVSGGNDEMVILIPEPAGGAVAKVTVQVFTATGKPVRTFYRNAAYSTITDGRIRWNGTNDAGKDLGPGVYFVQVRTAEYKRALKVMIVR